MLRRLLPTAAAPLLAALLAACGHASRPAAVAATGRIIPVSDTIDGAENADTLRFGRLGSGEIAVMRFVLHNVARRPLRIVSYERSCGCLSLDYDDQPIMPDEKRPVALTFDTRGEWGWQFKLVEIRFDGLPRPTRIFAEAEIH